MEAMPNAVPVFDHFRIGVPGFLAGLRGPEVSSLHIPDFRDDDDLLSFQRPFIDQVAEDAADQPLAVAIHIIRGRIDQITATEECLDHGLAMFRFFGANTISAEPKAT